MSHQTALEQIPVCPSPEIGRLLTPYCFGRATAQERQLVEAHLPLCAACQKEIELLNTAIQVLENDRSLLGEITATEVAGAFGISSRLSSILGGHVFYVLLISMIYGLMLAEALVLELAWQFDRYSRQAIGYALLITVYGFLSSVGGSWVEWKWIKGGKDNGLAIGAMIYLISIVLLFASVRSFLPTAAIVEANFQTYTVQGAYLRALIWIIPLMLFFLILPLHFVLALQRELQNRRHSSVLAILTGQKLNVTPRGTFYVSPVVLFMGLVLVAIIAFLGASHLFENLRPAPYLNLYTTLYYLRWGLYFGLGLTCIFWYQRALNEIKRECLMIERISREN